MTRAGAPFLVGVSTAVSAEVAVAVLLYGGPGFTRSLTTALAVGAAALAIGLWFGEGVEEGGQGLRKRWLLALSSFLVAAAFATLWTVMPAIGDGRLGQGAGLAALAGLPLYACGSVLAGLSARDGPRGTGRGRPGVAATAMFGAAMGFVVTGVLLPRAPTPGSLLVGCLVLLSLAAMIDAGTAGADTTSEERSSAGPAGGETSAPGARPGGDPPPAPDAPSRVDAPSRSEAARGAGPSPEPGPRPEPDAP